ncbi:MAG: MogA/MoaB family molybdenum cofactor biosynthesis protein [Chloroflexi bacterium]|nr:MogA/MoaB family molybdenum cofactor biosynthesis protein [Chloroflexota bacterium]
MFTVGILTISDMGYRGQRVDTSSAEIREVLSHLDSAVIKYEIVPDEKDVIARKLIDWADEKIDLIVTTGGTGLAARDVTPEATLEVVEKLVPGLAEAMRAETLKKTPYAMLSRAVAGIRGSTLIVNLPGSPKAVRECLEAILPALPHAIAILKGQTSDHRLPQPIGEKTG